MWARTAGASSSVTTLKVTWKQGACCRTHLRSASPDSPAWVTHISTSSGLWASPRARCSRRSLRICCRVTCCHRLWPAETEKEWRVGRAPRPTSPTSPCLHAFTTETPDNSLPTTFPHGHNHMTTWSLSKLPRHQTSSAGLCFHPSSRKTFFRPICSQKTCCHRTWEHPLRPAEPRTNLLLLLQPPLPQRFHRQQFPRASEFPRPRCPGRRLNLTASSDRHTGLCSCTGNPLGVATSSSPEMCFKVASIADNTMLQGET